MSTWASTFVSRTNGASAGVAAFLIYESELHRSFWYFGLMILVGWKVRTTAILLAGFTVLSGALYHFVPAQGMEGFQRMSEMNHFFKNLSIAGGFLMLAALGAGPLSVDEGAEGGRTETA